MRTTKEILEYIINAKANGNTFQELNTQMKIMIKGVNVKAILNADTHDDPVATEKLIEIAKEFDVDLTKMPA